MKAVKRETRLVKYASDKHNIVHVIHYSNIQRSFQFCLDRKKRYASEPKYYVMVTCLRTFLNLLLSIFANCHHVSHNLLEVT